MVSISLGNSCDFLYRQDAKEAARKIVLQSGDILLFGGCSRHMLHTVPVVHLRTCPPPLQELHLSALAAEHEGEGEGACSLIPAPSCFRINLTFRHAPELLGREHEDRWSNFHLHSGFI